MHILSATMFKLRLIVEQDSAVPVMVAVVVVSADVNAIDTET